MTRRTEQVPEDRLRTELAEPRAGRIVGASVAGFILALYVWRTRGELAVSLPALGLCALVGLAGVGLASAARRLFASRANRRRMSDPLFFLACSVTIVLVTGGATWFGGEWMGGRSVLGSTGIAFIVGMLLLFGRHAVQGPVPPEGPDDRRARHDGP